MPTTYGREASVSSSGCALAVSAICTVEHLRRQLVRAAYSESQSGRSATLGSTRGHAKSHGTALSGSGCGRNATPLVGDSLLPMLVPGAWGACFRSLRCSKHLCARASKGFVGSSSYPACIVRVLESTKVYTSVAKPAGHAFLLAAPLGHEGASSCLQRQTSHLHFLPHRC